MFKQLSLWRRLKLWWNGRIYIGFDRAADGAETTVEGHMLGGKFFITKVTRCMGPTK
jgi:hypothetical protein